MKQLFLILVSSLVLFPAWGASSKGKKEKGRLLELVEAQRDALAGNSMAIWRLAELGFKENGSSAILQERLSEAGFSVEAGVAGMPTAFVASYRNGEGPVIGLLAEYDALAGLSQDTVPRRQPAEGMDNGHGCGHNLIGAASVAAAVAIRQWMEQEGISGEIRVYGCPAEEGGMGKVYLVRGGFFDGVDAVMHWHPTDYNGYYTSPHMAIINARFRFRGQSSHAAASPDRGRSALDGAMLMATAVEYLREHIPDKTRIHYIISNGGQASNVVPDFAEINLAVRHASPEVVRSVWERVGEAARGAAIAAGVETDCEISSGSYPLLINKTLVEVAATNFNALSIPRWDEGQMDFARSIASTLENPGELDPTVILPPYPAKEVNASTDVGDVSWVVPTVGIFAMSWIPGSAAHSWQTVAASGSPLGIQGAFIGSEVIATTVADLLLDPGIITKAKEEMQEDLGEGFIYQSLAGDRQPDI